MKLNDNKLLATFAFDFYGVCPCSLGCNPDKRFGDAMVAVAVAAEKSEGIDSSRQGDIIIAPLALTTFTSSRT